MARDAVWRAGMQVEEGKWQVWQNSVAHGMAKHPMLPYSPNGAMSSKMSTRQWVKWTYANGTVGASKKGSVWVAK